MNPLIKKLLPHNGRQHKLFAIKLPQAESKKELPSVSKDKLFNIQVLEQP